MACSPARHVADSESEGEQGSSWYDSRRSLARTACGNPREGWTSCAPLMEAASGWPQHMQRKAKLRFRPNKPINLCVLQYAVIRIRKHHLGKLQCCIIVFKDYKTWLIMCSFSLNACKVMIIFSTIRPENFKRAIFIITLQALRPTLSSLDWTLYLRILLG